MPRYIDADKLLDLIRDHDAPPRYGYLDLWDIEDALTEDVQPVVHANWTILTKRKAIFLDNANEQYKALGFPHRNILQMRCSNCGMLTQVDGSIAYEYCPHCGAKMDKK